ncbi:MFS transporter [Sporolactobacillus pectinivorans]|uniref:MFS transporter n=1 Tax=Sporolactobacillus pectinivorans TaxID=1591408 RepID=UPI000C26966C|nr:MFS transporter [Sporolactobacillus pectinivorans]
MTKINEIGARLDRLPISKWHRRLFWLIGMGLLIDGFDNYISGIVLAQLVKTGWSNNYYNAAFSSATLAGLFIGSILAGFVGDRFGRKVAYQFNLLLFGVASILAALSTSMMILIFLRGVIGIGLGAEIVVGFSTFTEFLPSKARGKWIATLSLVGNCAPPVATLIGYFVMPALGPDIGWRAMFVIAGIAALLVWLARRNMPESPRWYASRGYSNKADQILSVVEKEIESDKGVQLPPAVDQYQGQEKQKIAFSMLFKKPLLKRTILGISVLIGMNISLYTITTWIPTLFIKQGITITSSLLMTTLILFGAPLGVFVATRIIDKFPRKWLGVILLCMIALLGYCYSVQTSPISIVIFGFFLISFLYIYVCFASAVYVPELWPTEIRLRGTGFCTAIGRAVAIFTPYGVAWILTDYGEMQVFLAIGILMILVAVVIASIGIETKQKSIEEISYEAYSEEGETAEMATKI